MDESTTAENKRENRQKPPLSVGRIARELLAGIGLSFAIMTLVGFLEVTAFFGGIGNGADNRTTFASMVSKFIPAVSGIAGAVGVYLLGSRGNQTGSLRLTLAFGFLAGLLKPAMLHLENRLPEVVGIILFYPFGPLVLIVPSIFSTIGFNLTRRYKEPLLPQDIENRKKAYQKPPRNLIRIACEILIGAAMAAVFAFLSLYVVGYGGTITGLGDGCMDGLMILGIMAYVVPPFYLLGCAIGVYFVGRIGNQTGSFLATLGGVFLSVPVVAILYFYMHVAESMMLGIEKIILWPLVFLTAPSMATLCFNLTRRYKELPSP